MGVTADGALIIAAGEISSEIINGLISNKKLNLAVDGGYYHCLEYNIMPDIIIGDFDSLDLQLLDKRINIIHNKGQEETDLVKAINWAISSEIRDLDIIGVESGRSDHILGTFAALAEINQDDSKMMEIKLHLYDFVVRYVPRNKQIKLKLKEETHLSLFCLSESYVTLRGVKWPLNNEKMSFSTRGIHNYSIKSEIEIFIHEGGPALLFTKRDN